MLSAVALDIGLLTYGHHIMRALGNKITYHSPSRGFCMELGAMFTVLRLTRAVISRVPRQIRFVFEATHTKLNAVCVSVEMTTQMPFHACIRQWVVAFVYNNNCARQKL